MAGRWQPQLSQISAGRTRGPTLQGTQVPAIRGHVKEFTTMHVGSHRQHHRLISSTRLHVNLALLSVFNTNLTVEFLW